MQIAIGRSIPAMAELIRIQISVISEPRKDHQHKMVMTTVRAEDIDLDGRIK